MPRLYLPLLPLPVLAAIVAISACSKAKTDEPSVHVIPPAAPLVMPAGANVPPPPGAVARSSAPATGDEVPTAQDVAEFHRAVRK